MKFVQDRPYAKPDEAARQLLEIANATLNGRAKREFRPFAAGG
jgi:hypothetical protein